jgi:hypothetical protein
VKRLFIPAGSKAEAEQEAPRWATRLVRVTGGYMAFSSDAALRQWRAGEKKEVSPE